VLDGERLDVLHEALHERVSFSASPFGGVGARHAVDLRGSPDECCRRGRSAG
jgi:hypothetical protein